MARTGGCLCGEVRYECSADPIAAYLCHCTDCRRASGGPYSACVLFPRSAVQVTQGKPARFEHPGGSGKLVAREFCARCGSQLFSNSRAREDWIVVRSGSLDDPGDTAPQLHIFCDSALDWALPEDGAQRFPQGR